jgi:hypothetical protein
MAAAVARMGMAGHSASIARALSAMRWRTPIRSAHLRSTRRRSSDTSVRSRERGGCVSWWRWTCPATSRARSAGRCPRSACGTGALGD